nr:DUF1153 domain-containing protein [Croceibacterium ferulae]
MVKTDEVSRVIGPLGTPITLDDLPPPEISRWVIRRKAEVVAAVNGGLLTIDEVLARYGLTLEEFVSWQRGFERSGMRGLRTTKTQQYRTRYTRQMTYHVNAT